MEEYPAYIVCNMFTEKESVYVGDNNNPKVTQEGRDGDENPGNIAQITSGTTLGFKYFACKNVKAFSIKARGYASGSFFVPAYSMLYNFRTFFPISCG